MRDSPDVAAIAFWAREQEKSALIRVVGHFLPFDSMLLIQQLRH
jgi:hypothetical protein